MIILKTNIELKHTFERLIQTMGVPVEWTGMFAVIGDYLILQGKVRSLFFNFENKKVITNILEIPTENEMIDITEAPKVQNVINIVLYAFGKWGTISGLKVDKNYAMLNELFTGVLKEFYIDPEYTSENFRFYKEKIRLSYEDVVQLAIDSQEKLPEEPAEEKESRQGLWHKLVWKKRQALFEKVETTFAERQKQRLGNNFYMVGYLCSECHKKLHMVVFPPEKAFRIGTVEGGVMLARAYTCDTCNSFCTPVPGKLLSEGDVYQMSFVDDRKAYEDYLELLGAAGERTSNYKFNEFEKDALEADEKKSDTAAGNQGKEAGLAELFHRIETMPETEFGRLQDQVEEGFYTLESAEKYEKSLKHQANKRRIKKEQERRARVAAEKKVDGKAVSPKESAPNARQQADVKEHVLTPPKTSKIPEKPESERSGREEKISQEENDRVRERYDTKMSILDRLSEGQRRELKAKISQEKYLCEGEKQAYLAQIEDQETQRKVQAMEKKAQSCKGKSHARIKKIIEEIENEGIDAEKKAPILEKLYRQKKQQGEQEAALVISHIHPHMDFARFKEVEQQLKEYEDVDFAPYKDKIEEGRKFAEQQEISNLVRRVRKNSREDFRNLLQRLEDGSFSKENAAPYLGKIKGKVRQMDEEAIAEICQNSLQMSFEEGMDAYHKIEDGLFLPELKLNALERISKRLAKIKTEECELLVRKLKNDLAGKIKENSRHHFYPAQKVLMGEASPEETAVIDAALACYGSERGSYEYPIFVADTSRNETGKEGMILTPEHLLYSTFLNSYDIPVSAIARFKASTGLLNRGLTAELKNGTKIKLPYAVEHGELLTWASVLKDFVKYLQEKPESRNVEYLAKEKHEKICCFRCGYVYKGGDVCPKCGYKNNQ